MNKQSLDGEVEVKHEHGNMGAYVIGFILSLAFSLIPYSLVVKKTISGTTLLVTIMGFAVLQMIVQVTFFLHLGRGPKPNWNLFFFVATIGIVLVVVSGSIVIINNLHYNMLLPGDQVNKLTNDEGIYQIGGQQTGACQVIGSNHAVTIKNGQASPVHTAARQCDTLTFINVDSPIRDIAFGPHLQHQAYAGETELVIQKGLNKTITLSATGTYQFHDHLHEETAGDFTVNP